MNEPTWIDAPLALAIHARMLGLHGGAAGVRDIGMLHSALSRPRQRAAYGAAPDLADLAAAYGFGLVRNHPFVDGNKRTAFVIAALFVELNGARFIGSEESAAGAVVALASGEIGEGDFAAFLRGAMVGPMVGP